MRTKKKKKKIRKRLSSLTKKSLFFLNKYYFIFLLIDSSKTLPYARIGQCLIVNECTVCLLCLLIRHIITFKLDSTRKESYKEMVILNFFHFEIDTPNWYEQSIRLEMGEDWIKRLLRIYICVCVFELEQRADSE